MVFTSETVLSSGRLWQRVTHLLRAHCAFLAISTLLSLLVVHYASPLWSHCMD
jgi:hypothetical protein